MSSPVDPSVMTAIHYQHHHCLSLQYLVDWKGYGLDDRSWELANNLHAPDLVQQYHKTYPDKPGPSV
ncbi:UNVERIFIED_CONTAM: hypothetical protein K2H54_050151 [Gekko kuhli]